MLLFETYLKAGRRPKKATKTIKERSKTAAEIFLIRLMMIQVDVGRNQLYESLLYDLHITEYCKLHFGQLQSRNKGAQHVTSQQKTSGFSESSFTSDEMVIVKRVKE